MATNNTLTWISQRKLSHWLQHPKIYKRSKADVSTLLYARLRQGGCIFSLMCCVQCIECFFTFFQTLLKSIAYDQFGVVPRLDGAQGKKEVRRSHFLN